ncbi:MAG TPA: AAA family ATPase, partial [Gammaproteobacteria bacterium]
MYLDHFGLEHRPFAITPDPRFLYLSERYREALAHLLFGVGEGGGFVLLTGEVGTGKTTLCRGLLEQLPDDVDAALVINPRVSAGELLAAVCDELHVAREPAAGGKALVDALNRHLLAAHAAGRRTVLIIDEAQNLGAEALEQVRLLTNLETATEKLLQIILIGQPELRELLARRELRQLAQRVTARYHLEPMRPDEIEAYIDHRLRLAGADGGLFTGAAKRRVCRASRGIARLVNTISDRALLGAYASGKQRVDAGTVARAAREVLDGSGTRRWVPAWLLAGGALLAGLAAWAVVLQPPGGLLPATPAPERPA